MKKSRNVKTSKRPKKPKPKASATPPAPNRQSEIDNRQSLPLVTPGTRQSITSRGIQTVEVIRCPNERCGSDSVVKNGSGVGVLYYKCRRCLTCFKVRKIDPRKGNVQTSKRPKIETSKSRNVDPDPGRIVD